MDTLDIVLIEEEEKTLSIGPNKNCPKCGAGPDKQHIENYDPIWKDGDVVCECGTKVRNWDAS